MKTRCIVAVSILFHTNEIIAIYSAGMWEESLEETIRVPRALLTLSFGNADFSLYLSPKENTARYSRVKSHERKFHLRVFLNLCEKSSDYILNPAFFF